MSLWKKAEHITTEKTFLARKLKLGGTYPVNDEMMEYGVSNIAGGFL